MAVDADVIVVGAGPAGSAAAGLLARRGWRVLLVDRARFPRDKPCGDYCNPGAARILARLGWLEAVRRAGAAEVGEMTVYSRDGHCLRAPFPAGAGLLLARRVLDDVLLRQAASDGARVEDGCPVEEVRPDGACAAVRARGRTWRARLVVIATGARAALPARIPGLPHPKPRGRYTVGAYFAGLPLSDPAGQLHLGPDLYCGVAHFGGGVANVSMALPRRWWGRGGPEAAFGSALSTLPVLADLLAPARRVSAYRCAGPVGFRARPAAAPPLLLAGDAAAQMEPLTGQGISFALRSAVLLARAAHAALTAGEVHRLRRYTHRLAREFAMGRAVAHVVSRLATGPCSDVLVRRLSARRDLAETLLGVTGDVLSPAAVLSVGFWVRMLGVGDAHRA